MYKFWKWITIGLVMSLFLGCSGDNADPPPIVPGAEKTCLAFESIYNIYSAGFVHFRIANVDDKAWDISTEKTWTKDDLCGYKNSRVYDALPGFPTKLGKPGDSLDNVNFFVHFQTGACLGDSKKETPVFDMTLKSDVGDFELTLSSSLKYNPPPTPTGHPFWDFLKDGFDMIKGLVETPEDPWGGFKDWASGLHGIASGGVNGGSTNNEMPDKYYGTYFITQLTGTMDSKPLNPLDGSFCGGDEYTITDGDSLVVEMVAGRTQHSPGEVGLAIYRWDRFFALRAAYNLEDWRQQKDQDGSHPYLDSPYNEVLERVFANYNNPDKHEICGNADGTKGYF